MYEIERIRDGLDKIEMELKFNSKSYLKDEVKRLNKALEEKNHTMKNMVTQIKDQQVKIARLGIELGKALNESTK